MQKTRMGISVGLMGAAAFFFGFFGGYVATALLVGYILLFEENAWLKRTAVKAIVLTVMFSLVYALIAYLPDLVSFIYSFVNLFEGHLDMNVVNQLATVLRTTVVLLEKTLFIVMGVKALRQGTVVFPALEKFISKHM